MTIDEFFSINNGKFVEVAGSADAKNQCADLANLFIRDYLKQPIIEWTNAKDFPSKAGEKYDFIGNSETNFPLKGDIVVWNGRVGKGAGHIAICTEHADFNSFTSFDQNWPINTPCHFQEHNYANVSGWLRFRGVIDMSEVDTATLTDANNWRDLMKALHVDGLSVDEVVKRIDKGNDIQTDSNNWKQLCTAISMESVEAITAYIDKLKEVQPDIAKLLKEKEKECDGRCKAVEISFLEREKALRDQLVDLDDLSASEVFNLWVKKFLALLPSLLTKLKTGKKDE